MYNGINKATLMQRATHTFFERQLALVRSVILLGKCRVYKIFTCPSEMHFVKGMNKVKGGDVQHGIKVGTAQRSKLSEGDDAAFLHCAGNESGGDF